jgi:2-polyprenyl-3-methyl-5-hydroxy-6-metoxy-1,4-benzoquinol methylase
VSRRFQRAVRRIQDLLTWNRDTRALYQVLYAQVHDLDHALDLAQYSTAGAFGRQWQDFPEGEGLLSDIWFRERVVEILTAEEILLAPDWFRGKTVLDAGCGVGRWSYGFSQLGANLTCVDVNKNALDTTAEAISAFDNPQRFICTALEDLSDHVPAMGFDLVFCWGVAHHCASFTRVLDNLARAVGPGGVLYLYLYGRESLSVEDDLRLFRDRVAYNVLMSDQERMAFLLQAAGGDRNQLNSVHDIYAPLINRRFTFGEVEQMLGARGFHHCVRTIDHTEVFVRATRSPEDLAGLTLRPHAAPYWFERRRAERHGG